MDTKNYSKESAKGYELTSTHPLKSGIAGRRVQFASIFCVIFCANAYLKDTASVAVKSPRGHETHYPDNVM